MSWTPSRLKRWRWSLVTGQVCSPWPVSWARSSLRWGKNWETQSLCVKHLCQISLAISTSTWLSGRFYGSWGMSRRSLSIRLHWDSRRPPKPNSFFAVVAFLYAFVKVVQSIFNTFVCPAQIHLPEGETSSSMLIAEHGGFAERKTDFWHNLWSILAEKKKALYSLLHMFCFLIFWGETERRKRTKRRKRKEGERREKLSLVLQVIGIRLFEKRCVTKCKKHVSFHCICY